MKKLVPGGDAHPLYTCIATCVDCGGKEIYRLRHVPLGERQTAIVDLPWKALCEIPEHNTFPAESMNFGADLTWYREVYDRRGKLKGLVKEESPHFFDTFGI
jgi:hypothetical protein